MIVCLCEGLNDREIRTEIQRGARSVVDLGRSCGAGSHCGMCRHQIRGMLRSEGVELRRRPAAVAPTVEAAPAA